MRDPADFRAEAEALRAQLVAWRRDLHRHPELALQEHHTAGVIAEQLRALGYDVHTGIGGTGVVALLAGQQSGPTAMARFDMDALPIQEANEVGYASQTPGVMHACGHDAHMAIGLGVAALMAQHRSGLAGTLKLVFQPAEEALDGALHMIQAGVLESPRPDVFLSAHIWNEKPVGTIDVAPGPVMAAAQKWTCVVRGRGGHGAQPHLTVDPIVAAAQMIVALQAVVSRNVHPLEAAVVTVGTLHGGSAVNIIPDRVDMGGTMRTYKAEVRETLVRRLREVLEGVAAACGAQVDLELGAVLPAVNNDEAVTAVVRRAAEAIVGAGHVSSSHRTMGSEDASLFMEKVPGCYFFLGSANHERGLDAPHHSARFDFDETVLPLGAATMALALAHYLLP